MYDGLNRLVDFTRGTHTQSWDQDALGNFNTVTTDGVDEDREHNSQNELTMVGTNTLTYDENGNLTTDETGRQLVWDAWNRLVEVKDDLGVTIVRYAIDAQGWRITEDDGSVLREFFYSSGWQLLEERVDGEVVMQYVWSPVYVDAMILRDRDTDANGTLDERLYVVHDANFNVTALVDVNGDVVERFAYDPYGVATVYDASWTEKTASDFDWQYLHQGLRFEEETGLYHNRMREYSPTLMRFVSADPVAFAAGSANFYQYLGNSPATYVDYYGLQGLTPQRCGQLAHDEIMARIRSLNWSAFRLYTNQAIVTIVQGEQGSTASPQYTAYNRRIPDVVLRSGNLGCGQGQGWVYEIKKEGLSRPAAMRQLNLYVTVLNASQVPVNNGDCSHAGTNNLTPVLIPGCGQVRWYCLPGGYIWYWFAKPDEQPQTPQTQPDNPWPPDPPIIIWIESGKPIQTPQAPTTPQAPQGSPQNLGRPPVRPPLRQPARVGGGGFSSFFVTIRTMWEAAFPHIFFDPWNPTTMMF